MDQRLVVLCLSLALLVNHCSFFLRSVIFQPLEEARGAANNYNVLIVRPILQHRGAAKLRKGAANQKRGWETLP